MQKKTRGALCAADITALICAVLCAGCLITWSVGKKPDAITVGITYTSPKPSEEKGFWDRFSEAVAGAFGFGYIDGQG